MKILIAEDDNGSRHVLQKILENWGHEAVVARNGAEAWRVFQTDSFQVVISDWMMPEMDGLELVKRIRSRELQEYVYLILLTAKSGKDDLIQALEVGADDFLKKPVDHGELHARLIAAERIIRLEQNLARHSAELAAANDRMRLDLNAAARIQQSLLPVPNPTFEGARFAWTLKSCNELGGDILNIFRLDESHVGFYLLDVSGHGVPAALLSVTLSQLLSPRTEMVSLLEHSDHNERTSRPLLPHEIARQLNQSFPMDQQIGQFFTLFYGLLDVRTNELNYVSAGHPNAFVLSSPGETTLLKSSGPPIGVLDEVSYSPFSLQLQQGDRVYVYSDGLSEAMNAKREAFGLERLISLADDEHLQDLEAGVHRILQSVQNWCGESGLRDDVSCLALETVNAAPERLNGRLATGAFR